MKVIDQNSAAAALEIALTPAPGLIDGRTETERLNFLCEFAALLNFYDGNNQLNGTWQPFLLKDPVFLLASIAHTDYLKEHKLFVKTCANLQGVINSQITIEPITPDPVATEKANEMVALFNQLFDQLTRVFLRIEQWTSFMQMDKSEYDLKKYVIEQVKYTYNAYLWAVLSLRDFLASSGDLTDESTKLIIPVRDYVFDSFTDELWTKGAGTMPFMQVLGLYTIDQVQEEPPGGSSTSGPIPYGVTLTPQKYFDGLKNTGNLLFKFYRTIVHHSKAEYEKEKIKKSSYPDTLLLRTFSDLMKVHQAQLNGIADKHLHFYYTDILKQTEQPAVADSVFISIVLGKNITVFDMPAGTQFNAGADANKNPILFASTEEVSLNAGVISGVYTLANITEGPAGGIDKTFSLGFSRPPIDNWVIAIQSDRKIIAGGSFGNRLNGNTVRLNADGSLDNSFDSGTIKLKVCTLAIQKDGKIIIGGSGGEGAAAANILRLEKTGVADAAFQLKQSFPTAVCAIALQADGKIIAGGYATVAGQNQLYLSRLNADGSADTSFTPAVGVSSAGATIYAISIQDDGKIVAGGSFASYNGVTINNLVRLNADGTVDATFVTGTGTNQPVWSLALEPDGKIVIGGNFTTYNGQAAVCLARLDKTGKLDAGFQSPVLNPGPQVSTIRIQDDGRILIAGSFTLTNGSQNIARLCANGDVDETFYTGAGADQWVRGLALQGDGKVVFGGQEIKLFNGESIGAIARLSKERGLAQLYLQNIASPGTVVISESGQALPWETFGGTTNQDSSAATVKQLSFAFGSPMLFLQEGTRNITINFTFDSPPDPIIFNNAQVFLSTAKAWLAVDYAVEPVDAAAPDTVSLNITLDSTQSAIVPFASNPNPDGLTCVWPMFKMTFGSFTDLAVPPVLTSIGIDVTVTGVTTLALYNDNGLLNTKNPFQLFGPIVNMNSNFLIGSNEIFSKPLNWLSVELDWDALPPPTGPASPQSPATPPPDPALQSSYFGAYYTSYNTDTDLFPATTQWTLKTGSGTSTDQSTETPVTSSTPTSTAKTPGKFRTFMKNVWNVISWPVRYPVQKIKGLFSKKKNEPVSSTDTEATANTSTGSTSAPAASTPPIPPGKGQYVYFSSICFTVEFSMLGYNAWSSINMYNYSDEDTYTTWLEDPDNTTTIAPSGTANNFQLYDTSWSGSEAHYVPGTSSVFGYFASANSAAPVPDPTIQNTPLVYNGSNQFGFVKMTLVNPAYGFGASVYATVVTYVVTQNAVTMMKEQKDVSASDLLPAAGAPFVPTVKGITAGYGASQVYDLTKAQEDYPLQYFYYTPFANYTAYDNSPAVTDNYSVDISMIGDPGKITGLQLVPSFTSNTSTEETLPCSGAMYIGFTGLVPLNPLNLFFELATTYAAAAQGAEVNYYYLSTQNGWKPLSLLKDGTNQFTCSGIITLNIPSDIATQDGSMPVDTSWIAIGASTSGTGAVLDLSSFAQVVLLAPNGVELTRTGTNYLTDTTVPVISSGAITKPENPVAEIGSIAQPFASFGGRAAEDQAQMYTRVSRRLKTKDRAVSVNDIFTLITQHFPDIYFSGTVFSPDTNITTVYVVEGFDSYTDANAYRPLVSECEMEKITDLLSKRVSLFSNITVSNYTYQYVTVSATVTVKQGYVPQAMSAGIVQSLNIFLSPWIANSGQEQSIIGQPVTATQVASFIRKTTGVVSVTDVKLYSGDTVTALPVQTVTPGAGILLVSSLKHTINASLVT